MRQDIPSITVLGIPVACLTVDEAVEEVLRLHDAGGPAIVVFANAHALNLAARDARFRADLRRADLVLNDGSGLALAARLQGRRFPANLNGSDLTPRILAVAAAHDWSVFLLGAEPGVAEEAGERLVVANPGLRVVGTQHGFTAPSETADVVQAIAERAPDLLLVAMGNPHQEQWLVDNLAATGAPLGIGVGAYLDFVVQRVPRAPAWMNRAGIEWLFRLYQEPGRMWRRYVLGNPLFVWRVVRERWRVRG